MLNSSHETWCAVVGFDGLYEVSSLGRVRSLHARHGVGGRILSPKRDRYGYLAVRLYGTACHADRSVHAIVAEAFIGARPSGMQVAHADGNKSNNRPENLRFATPLENTQDKFSHGSVRRGVGHGRAKLSEADVVAIRSSGLSHREIAERFGISGAQVSHIKSRKQWGHVA